VTVEEAILARIEDLSPVTAIVGTRVYLDMLPQGPTYPAVRVVQVSDLATQHLRGPDGMRYARVQVDHYAEDASGVDTYEVVSELWAAVYGDGFGTTASGVFGWKGTIGSPGFYISNVEDAGRRRHYDSDERRVLTMSQDYRVWYRD
jgi:hypothetical protein